MHRDDDIDARVRASRSLRVIAWVSRVIGHSVRYRSIVGRPADHLAEVVWLKVALVAVVRAGASSRFR